MGTFQGHALPGAFFVVFSLWWTIRITQRHLIVKKHNFIYFSSNTYLLYYKHYAYYPLEGIIKVLSCTLGMVFELFASFDYGKESYPIWIGDLQHFSMYLFFCTSGIVDILTGINYFLPQNTDYMVFMMAFVNEAYLFSVHLVNRTTLDVMLHQALIVIILMCACSVMLEVKYPTSPLVAYGRCYCVLLQGIVFIQVGFILYNPFSHKGPWVDSANNRMLAACVISWHLFSTLVILFITVLLIRKYSSIKLTDAEYFDIRTVYRQIKQQRYIKKEPNDIWWEESEEDIF